MRRSWLDVVEVAVRCGEVHGSVQCAVRCRGRSSAGAVHPLPPLCTQAGASVRLSTTGAGECPTMISAGQTSMREGPEGALMAPSSCHCDAAPVNTVRLRL